MTIQEASQKKAELEKNLIEQFEKFEAETNMCGFDRCPATSRSRCLRTRSGT